MLKKPDILILDEATSNLDTITQTAIVNTLEELKGNITQIIIAHRLTTVRRCDRIYVLEKGRVIESGTHDELIKHNALYNKMWKGKC